MSHDWDRLGELSSVTDTEQLIVSASQARVDQVAHNYDEIWLEIWWDWVLSLEEISLDLGERGELTACTEQLIWFWLRARIYTEICHSLFTKKYMGKTISSRYQKSMSISSFNISIWHYKSMSISWWCSSGRTQIPSTQACISDYAVPVAAHNTGLIQLTGLKHLPAWQCIKFAGIYAIKWINKQPK